jgi:biotin-dependent carboxylase-like uncharacterized protein
MMITVQDLGRPGYAHQGISASGAADALSLRIGNRLLGNPENAPALEMTLLGGAFEFERDTWVALAGAELEHTPVWECFKVRSGETLRCGPIRGGARCYLCVHGGIEVPLVLGSASTHLLSGLGGFQGRTLRKGDVLRIGPAHGSPHRQEIKMPRFARGAIRVTAAAQREWFSDDLSGAKYRVADDSDRMGVRLTGRVIRQHLQKQLLTEGVSLGAVQVTPEGQPIILFVEHQTTGGYPKIANVISADFHQVGQLRPRDEVVFEPVTIEQAIELLRQQEAWVASIAR